MLLLENKPELKATIQSLPKKPGCYLFYDSNDKLLYVGKANSLKSRVPQYFQKSGLGSHKSKKMVLRITNIDYILTDSPYDALILEQNLIKSKKPIFNILLMDDKRYPYIQLRNTKHPKFVITRTINPKRGIYFGPIATGYNAKVLFELLNFLYPFRKCSKLPKKKCIYYDLKQCLGPCIKNIEKEDYEPIIDEVKKIFSGNVSFLRNKLKKNIQNAVESQNYLLAKKWKKYLDSISSFEEERTEFNDLSSHHAFGIVEKDNILCIYVSFYLGGKWMGGSHHFLEIEESIQDTIKLFLLNFYNSVPKPKEIIFSTGFDEEDVSNILKTKINFPKKGFKKKVVDKAVSNAEIAISKSLPSWKAANTQRENGHKELEELVDQSLYSVMMMDNAHISLENYVSAFVTFINGIPQKQYYRYINLEKEKIRGDAEAVFKSVKKMFRNYKDNNLLFCDLLIVDGGIAQLRSAKQALFELNLNIKVISVFKDDKHSTSGIILEDEKRVYLEPGNLMKYLSIAQDEAHRFVNRYFQDKRDKQLITHTTEKIDSVGQSTWNKLIKRFATLDNIKNASLAELMDIIPEKSARNIYNFFNTKMEKKND